MKRPFGQNFLFDGNILKKIVRCSGLAPEDTAVEIGPGLGTLTKFLADSSSRVIAIEFDKKLIDRLKENLAGKDNVEVVRCDALKFPFETIEGRFRVVANIPYNITTPLIFKLLEHKEKIQSMTLLVQKEVAKRIIAKHNTKDYGVLSISLQFQTKPSLEFTVSRKVFSPPPSVDSAVVHFEVPPVPRYKVGDADHFIKVVRTAFVQRRKTILNGLRAFKGIHAALEAAGIDPGLRPENLSIEDFVKISDALSAVEKQQ